ncbi:MAG: PIN domain-containing protein [Verrucomicrobiales bacterium]
MADLPVLIDSNVYISLLRQGRDPALELTEQVSLTDLATCGMVRLEVLRGIKTLRSRERLAAFLDVLLYVPTDNRLWDDAMGIAWMMQRNGRSIPGPDAVIAACALRIGATVLTFDSDFASVPRLRVERPNWI